MTCTNRPQSNASTFSTSPPHAIQTALTEIHIDMAAASRNSTRGLMLSVDIGRTAAELSALQTPAPRSCLLAIANGAQHVEYWVNHSQLLSNCRCQAREVASVQQAAASSMREKVIACDRQSQLNSFLAQQSCKSAWHFATCCKDIATWSAPEGTFRMCAPQLWCCNSYHTALAA